MGSVCRRAPMQHGARFACRRCTPMERGASFAISLGPPMHDGARFYWWHFCGNGGAQGSGPSICCRLPAPQPKAERQRYRKIEPGGRGKAKKEIERGRGKGRLLLVRGLVALLVWFMLVLF